MHQLPNISKEKIQDLYQNNGIKKVAKSLNVKENELRRLMASYNIPIRPVNDTKVKSLPKDKYGKWTVLGSPERSVRTSKNGLKYHRLTWLCQCECGTIRRLIHKELLYRSRSCGCGRFKPLVFTGTHVLGDRLYGNLASCAKGRGLEFTVSKDYLIDLFEKQGRLCALTGVEIGFWECNQRNLDKTRNKTASLDRIDNTKGYIEGNVHWVHKDINKMKWDFTLQDFQSKCSEVYGHNPKYIDGAGI